MEKAAYNSDEEMASDSSDGDDSPSTASVRGKGSTPNTPTSSDDIEQQVPTFTKASRKEKSKQPSTSTTTTTTFSNDILEYHFEDKYPLLTFSTSPTNATQQLMQLFKIEEGSLLVPKVEPNSKRNSSRRSVNATTTTTVMQVIDLTL